ncbi:DUF1003 domain-containing protein [Armatimonas sp.]|uniref:DUF1003 domain-containing protein n=1 Tax=Armatimonas sp. TaxID=1872638 RepID=UPI00286BA480|nr:DUF1003 domain-containing protein [Armatimonas sp.]
MRKFARLPDHVQCEISGKAIPLSEAIPVDLVRESIVPYLHAMCHDDHLDPSGFVSKEELNKARRQVMDAWASEEQGEMSRLRFEVAEAIKDKDTISSNVDAEMLSKESFGERLADKIASFGGSWKFILIFLGILFLWMGVNTSLVLSRPPDSFPFIFLNLILSCLAAFQAPVIMMSQNRQNERDRMRSENDYKVNLKAELEIKYLNEKMDTLIQDHWKHLLEIQQMQMEMIEELLNQNEAPKQPG